MTLKDAVAHLEIIQKLASDDWSPEIFFNENDTCLRDHERMLVIFLGNRVGDIQIEIMDKNGVGHIFIATLDLKKKNDRYFLHKIIGEPK